MCYTYGFPWKRESRMRNKSLAKAFALLTIVLFLNGCTILVTQVAKCKEVKDWVSDNVGEPIFPPLDENEYYNCKEE